MISIALFITTLVLIVLLNLIEKKKTKSLIYSSIKLLILCLIIQTSCMLLQSVLCSIYNLKPIYFEYISYIGGMFIPFSFLYFAITYKDKKVDFVKIAFLALPSVISLIVLWTNEFHHLFYEKYSILINETIFGKYFNIYTIWSYLLLIIALYIILTTTIKKSGFLSLQTTLIILGCLFPLVPNVLATFGIVSLTVYITPMMFAATALCFYFAIIRLKALNIIPVTLKAIIDNMSDAFVVVSDDGTIADINKTFIEKFKPLKEIKDKDNLFEILSKTNIIDYNEFMNCIKEATDKGLSITKEFHIEKGAYDRYFEVDFQPVKSRDGKEFVATLILLRDVTTAKKDMEIMLKNESLVTLGELAGGVAHDINTPISAIKSGLLIFKATAKTDDEKMLVERMDSCADKIVSLTNSLRNQIRNIGSNEVNDVNITNVIKDVSVVIHNELTKHKVNLNIDIKKDLIVKGNSAKLSQVLTNIIVNAVQAYEDRGGSVDVSVYEENNNAVISVKDEAGGIPEYIVDSIGKNILTTKGVSGTGFGLYLAYSVIKGSFGGEITFKTETGKGTTFYIRVPLG